MCIRDSDASAFDDDGYLRTGDIGLVDGDGYLAQALVGPRHDCGLLDARSQPCLLYTSRCV